MRTAIKVLLAVFLVLLLLAGAALYSAWWYANNVDRSGWTVDSGVYSYKDFYGDPVTGWQVCINVPSVIYSIPPAYPVYHVRYVRVYNYTPDYVYVGYYPGYVGCFVDRGVVVYGTGYRYAPWVGTYYYPWPATFGFGVSYSLGFGWGFNISWGAPIGWVGFGGAMGIAEVLAHRK